MCVDPLSAALVTAGAKGGLLSVFSGLGGLGTAASTAAGLVGAYSAVQQGQAAKAAAQATARQQEEAARDSLRAGEEESDRQRRAGAAMLSQQRIAMAANGVDVSASSAIEQLDNTRTLIEQDAFAIRKSALNQGRGLMQQATNSRVEGDSAASAGLWGGVGTLLTTGAKVGSKYAAWSRQARYA